MDKRDKKGMFSLIVSILTLAIMTVGGTFAYFSSISKSSVNAVSVGSASYALNLTISALYNQKSIIPMDDSDAVKAFENGCVDDYDWGACYAYNLVFSCDEQEQDIVPSIKFIREDIPNLKYMILDADDNYSVYKSASYAPSNYENLSEDSIILQPGVDRTLTLVVWLSNLEDDQNDESGKSFTGMISVNSALGNKITGTLNING